LFAATNDDPKYDARESGREYQSPHFVTYDYLYERSNDEPPQNKAAAGLGSSSRPWVAMHE